MSFSIVSSSVSHTDGLKGFFFFEFAGFFLMSTIEVVSTSELSSSWWAWSCGWRVECLVLRKTPFLEIVDMVPSRSVDVKREAVVERECEDSWGIDVVVKVATIEEDSVAVEALLGVTPSESIERVVSTAVVLDSVG